MADTNPQLSLAVNDRVVYPNQGVCRVAGIDTKEIAGQKLVFVTLKREGDGAIVMVPQSKLTSIGVRKVATQDDVQQVWAFLKSDSDKADLDWKQRARTNVERMAQGGIVGLAEVVKGLQVLSELRPLPTKERELYDNARHLLVSELSASMSVSQCDAEDAIDLALSPPGKERPKRTAEEFKRPGLDDELGLGEDLLELGGELELPAEEEEAEEGAEEETAEGEEGEPAEAAPKKGAKKPPAAPPRRPLLSDDEVTKTQAAALIPEDQLPVKRKRGRPPKPKPAVDPSAPPPAPKKRGRPPKPKPPVDPNAPPPEPKKRGRPPKSASKDAKKK